MSSSSYYDWEIVPRMSTIFKNSIFPAQVDWMGYGEKLCDFLQNTKN